MFKSFQFIVKLGKHQKSDVHKTNFTKMVEYKTSKTTGSIVTKLSEAHKNEKEKK